MVVLLIRGGRVLDPANKLDRICSLFIENGKIKAVLDREEEIEKLRRAAAAKAPVCEIDARNMYVLPGLIDLHTHIRETGTGLEDAAASACAAAMRGGFTTICPMPDMTPVPDSPEQIAGLLQTAKEVSKIHVVPIGALTKGQRGEEPADIEGMKDAGAAAVCYDGRYVPSQSVCREAIQKAAELGMTVFAHGRDTMIARDIRFAKETGAKIHLCNGSSKESVKAVKEAKEALIPVTAEVSPYQALLSADPIRRDDAGSQVSALLHSAADVRALREALRTNIMDCIATGDAVFGESDPENTVCLTVTELMEHGCLTPMQMAEKLSCSPARILGIDKGNLAVGKAADITIIHPKQEYFIETETKDKAVSSAGKRVRGKVKFTIVDGEIVYMG